MIESVILNIFMIRLFTKSKLIVCLLGFLGVGVLSGCTHHSAPKAASKRDAAYSKVSDQALLEDVTRTLNRLDETCVLELMPPELVLDATKSRNRKEVLANFTKDPKLANGPYDLLVVVSRNGQFDRLKVGPGDQIRLFADLGEDQFGKRTTINMVVKEYVEPNVVRVENNPLGGRLPYPERIEIWRYSSDRLRDLGERIQRFHQTGRAKGGYSLSRNDAPERHQTVACWEPSPDEAAIETIVERLNQWARDREPQADWKPSPLVHTLPEEYQIFVQPDDLAGEHFDSLDARTLQEDVWARDICHWAAKDARFQVPIWGVTVDNESKNDSADLAAANALFDWTIRHVQLLPDTPIDPNAQVGPEADKQAETAKPQYVPQQVWHTLLFGRGTAEQRAWVFARLARQQGLDVVTLGLKDAADPKAIPKTWASAVLVGGQLYLFDPSLGLPLPGPDGKGIATLEQVLADPEILRQLDLSGAEKYPVEAEDLKLLVALVDSSPLSLSQRGKVLEEQLVGKNRFVITGMKSKAIDEIKAMPGIHEIRLWDLPYRMLDAQLSLTSEGRRQALFNFLVYTFQPWLYKARILHFQGKFDAEMTERLFDSETAEKYSIHDARHFYTRSRPSDSDIMKRQQPDERLMMTFSKLNASYWLGLLALDDSDYRVAKDFFAERTLAITPTGPWTTAARYNLGRTEELLGEPDAAIEQYELDAGAPQGFGNRVRARWLKERESDSKPSVNQDEKAGEKKPPQESAAEEKNQQQPKQEKPTEDEPSSDSEQTPQEPAEKADSDSKAEESPEPAASAEKSEMEI